MLGAKSYLFEDGNDAKVPWLNQEIADILDVYDFFRAGRGPLAPYPKVVGGCLDLRLVERNDEDSTAPVRLRNLLGGKDHAETLFFRAAFLGDFAFFFRFGR